MKIPDIRWILKNKVLFRKTYTFNDELEVMKLMEKLHGNLFVDIGCNIGRYSHLMKHRFKKIYSVDPNPKYQAPFQFAFSNFDGYADFFIGNNIGSADSLIQNPHILGKDYQQSSSFKVRVIKWDTLGWDADLVKIDVEGAEFDVVDGMIKHLPKSVIIELHDERREMELHSKMSDKGYLMKQIDKNHFFFSLDAPFFWNLI